MLRGLPERGTKVTPLPVAPGDLQREISLLLGALGPQAPLSPQPILEQMIRSLAELPSLREFHELTPDSQEEQPDVMPGSPSGRAPTASDRARRPIYDERPAT